MKIIIEESSDCVEEQIVIRCKRMSSQLRRVVAAIQAQESLVAYKGQEIHRVDPEDIYYFEAVDRKTFLYTQKNVFELKQRLYELEDALGGDFQRISKSVVLNLRKLKSLNPTLNGRFEAVLDNSEKLMISRQYMTVLKMKFGI